MFIMINVNLLVIQLFMFFTEASFQAFFFCCLFYCFLSVAVIFDSVLIYKNFYIFGAFTSLKSQGIFLNLLENLENSGNFTLKFLSEPCYLKQQFLGFRTKCFTGKFLKLSTMKSDFIHNHWEKYKHLRTLLVINVCFPN